MNFLKNFYQHISSPTDKQMHLASRYHFFLSMTFDGVIFTYDKNMFDLSKLGYLVRAINLPNLQVKSGDYAAHEVVNTDVGTFSYPKLNSRAIPEVDQHMAITMIDTEQPVFEAFFIPWLRMVTDYNSLNAQNSTFLRANIYIDFFDNMNDNVMFEYVVKGAFPVFVGTPDLTYETKGMTTRDVRFVYNDLVLNINNSPASSMTNANMQLSPGAGQTSPLLEALGQEQGAAQQSIMDMYKPGPTYSLENYTDTMAALRNKMSGGAAAGGGAMNLDSFKKLSDNTAANSKQANAPAGGMNLDSFKKLSDKMVANAKKANIR
jgi:hypothetical protein